ncbi:MAG: hypothetical protein OHK0052_19680 [Anaerolineales bacterium]
MRDRRFVILWAVILMLLTSLPYLLGYAVQGEAWRFTGFVFGVEDGNSYIAKMTGGSAGAWLFRTPFSAYPQSGALAFLPYLLLGKLAAPPALHEQLVALFHLFRLAGIGLTVWATWDFLGFWLPDRTLRRWGLVLATVGGGLGWLLTLTGNAAFLGDLPLEFYSPETFGFLALYGLPHLAVGRAFLLWALLILARGERYSGWRAGLFLLGLGLMQPLTAAIAWMILAAVLTVGALWLWWRACVTLAADWGAWRALLGRVGIAGVVSAPLVGYSVIKFATDPFLQLWTLQNRILSPNPLHYLIAWGWLLPLAVWGGWLLWRADDVQTESGAFVMRLLPLAWALLLPFLAYAPYNLQRRMPEGGFVALSVLALVGLSRWQAQNARVRRWGARGLVLPLLPSAVFLLLGGALTVLNPALPLFRPADEVAVFTQLAQVAQPGEVVLTAYETGNALPAWAAVRVVIGHGPESARLEELRPRVAAFYAAETDSQARWALLREFNIRYVFVGPAERALGAWQPRAADGFVRLFEQGEYAVYAVQFANP